MIFVYIVGFFLVLVFFSFVRHWWRSKNDPLYSIDSNDPAMLEAQKHARTTLPYFWEHLLNPAEDEVAFSLKIKITDGDRTEHFWVLDPELVGDTVHGTIDNYPQVVSNVRDKERIQRPVSDISDWMIMKGDKIVGNYTLRAAITHETPARAEQMRAILAEETP